MRAITFATALLAILTLSIAAPIPDSTNIIAPDDDITSSRRLQRRYLGLDRILAYTAGGMKSASNMAKSGGQRFANSHNGRTTRNAFLMSGSMAKAGVKSVPGVRVIYEGTRRAAGMAKTGGQRFANSPYGRTTRNVFLMSGSMAKAGVKSAPGLIYDGTRSASKAIYNGARKAPSVISRVANRGKSTTGGVNNGVKSTPNTIDNGVKSTPNTINNEFLGTSGPPLERSKSLPINLELTPKKVRFAENNPIETTVSPTKKVSVAENNQIDTTVSLPKKVRHVQDGQFIPNDAIKNLKR